MKARLAVPVFFLALVGSAWPSASRAAVVVLANRTDREVAFSLALPENKTQEKRVAATDILVIPWAGPTALTLETGKERKRFQLRPNAVYFFADASGALIFEGLNFSGSADGPVAAEKLPAGRAPADDKAGILRVHLYVDDDEPGTRKVWEERLRARVAAASDVLEHHCRLKLEVAGTGEWESDNSVEDLPGLLRDFERKVKLPPDVLAIGFSSQRLPPAEGRRKLGAIQAPLRTHIVVREWMPPSERGRLEVLLHELGHHLGAVHSPESDSVMRSILGDDNKEIRRLRVGFDPVNTLVINLMAEEIRGRRVKRLEDVSPATKELLVKIYTEVGRVLTEDPSPPKYLRLLGAAPAEEEKASGPATPLIENSRKVLAAILDAAERNFDLPEKGNAGEQDARRTRDALTAYLVRAAAAAAQRLPQDQAAPAFLLALGIGLDTSDLIRNQALTKTLWQRIESEAARKYRLKVLGQPTIRDRHDWAQHFVVSAAFTAVAGARAAETAGLLKEVLDAEGGGGFSFADLAADLAGVAFAEKVLGSPALLEKLAKSFAVDDFTLDPEGLSDGLSQAEFAKEYGSVADARFLDKQQSLRKRIQQLDGHK